LEADADGTLVDLNGGGVTFQLLAAEAMAEMFLQQYGMPLTADVKYDAWRLQHDPSFDISDTCVSCIDKWVVESSRMDVAKDPELVAHCHACMKDLYPTRHVNKKSMQLTQMVSYGLASRFLGKYIMAPYLREVKADTEAKGSSTSLAEESEYYYDDVDEELICSSCSKKLLAFDGPHQQPQGWRQTCIACLEAKLERGEVFYTATEGDEEGWNAPARMQWFCAQHMTYQLFDEVGMPWSSEVVVDTSKLPESASDIVSKACFSCMRHWVLSKSMSVAKSFDLIAHCHMCLKEFDDDSESWEPGHAERVRETIYFAVASRFVGQYVLAPSSPMNEGAVMSGSCASLLDTDYADDEYSSSSSSSSIMYNKRQQAADNAHASGRVKSRNAKAQKQRQTVRHVTQPDYGGHPTGLFSWINSAWFAFWGPAVVFLSLALSLLVDLWLCGHESYLGTWALWIGLARKDAAAAAELMVRANRAASGSTTTSSRRQQQQELKQQARQQAGAGKRGKKKPAGKASSRSRDNINSSSSSQAASKDHSSTSRDSSSAEDSSSVNEGAAASLQQVACLHTSSSCSSSIVCNASSSAAATQQQHAPGKDSSSHTPGTAPLGACSSAAVQVQLDALLAAQLQEEEAGAATGADLVAAAAGRPTGESKDGRECLH
jgi:hypothetical protein